MVTVRVTTLQMTTAPSVRRSGRVNLLPDLVGEGRGRLGVVVRDHLKYRRE